jgi:hypothetical protein
MGVHQSRPGRGHLAGLTPAAATGCPVKVECPTVSLPGGRGPAQLSDSRIRAVYLGEGV